MSTSLYRTVSPNSFVAVKLVKYSVFLFLTVLTGHLNTGRVKSEIPDIAHPSHSVSSNVKLKRHSASTLSVKMRVST